MFERIRSEKPAAAAVAGSDVLTQVRDLRLRLADPPRDLCDAERVDLIRALEELKNTACAAQARVSVDFDASQRAAQAAAGRPARLQGRGVAAQVGLARRESPHRGARCLGLGKVLIAEMPHTYAALAAGWLSEWRATLLARETACLAAEHRAAVDQQLVGDQPGQVETWSDRRLVAEARKLAYRLDPHAVVRRIGNAEKDRCVTSRPAPDAMAYLTALLPAAQAVACYAALTKAADTARAAGDPRTRGQVMADTLAELLTGTKTAVGIPVEIQLVVTDQALFANLGAQPSEDPAADPDDPPIPTDPRPPDPPPDQRRTDPREEPGYLHGYGFVPAGWIRELIATLPEKTQAWIRRLYADPKTGQLVAMDSQRRRFPHAMRTFTVIRDRICRTPWCGAPTRHTDHPQDHAAGGTSPVLATPCRPPPPPDTTTGPRHQTSPAGSRSRPCLSSCPTIRWAPTTARPGSTTTSPTTTRPSTTPPEQSNGPVDPLACAAMEMRERTWYGPGLDPEELAFQRLYGPWQPMTPPELVELMEGFPAPWVGGRWPCDRGVHRRAASSRGHRRGRVAGSPRGTAATSRTWTT